MKKIIISTLLFGISVFAGALSAQKISKDQMRVFQTDDVEAFKKIFNKDDFNKCLAVKENSYDLLSFSIKYERKNLFNFLLNNTTDINRICNNQSPLMVAARYGKAEMAKSLVHAGADKTLKNANDEVAKDFAVKYQKNDLISILQ